MDAGQKETLIGWAEEYNDPKYFQEDPIIFPTRFARRYEKGEAVLADVEIAALLSSHLAWGRRAMIVRDCERMFEEMCWKPYDYVMNGEYRDENVSLHRTIKWSEFAGICTRLRGLYSENTSLEGLTDRDFRCLVYGQKEDRKAPNKKISMMRRWLVRDDGLTSVYGVRVTRKNSYCLWTYMSMTRPRLWGLHSGSRRTLSPHRKSRMLSARSGRRTHAKAISPFLATE